MTDREFVEQHWPETRDWSVIKEIGCFDPRVWHSFPTWLAAAEFTRQRLEEIRQLERELEKVRSMRISNIAHALSYSRGSQEYGRDAAEWGRLASRLESLLAEKRKGMKSAT